MNKALIVSLILMCVCLFVRICHLDNQLNEKEKLINTQFQYMGDGVYGARSIQASEGSLISKISQSGLGEVTQKHQKNADSVSLVTSEAKTSGTIRTGIKSETTNETSSQSKNGAKNDVSASSLTLTEKYGDSDLKIGKVLYDARSEAPWSYELLPKTFRVSTLITDEDGRKHAFTKLTLEIGDQKSVLPLSDSEITYGAPKKRWRLDNHYLLGIGGSLIHSQNYDISLNWSGVSYGSNKISPEYHFMASGLYLTDTRQYGVKISPVAYNLSNLTSITKSTYIAPFVNLDNNLDYSIGLTLLVNL
jgi:hypothetical protein